MTEPIPMVYGAIAAVMAQLSREGIGKDAVNEHDRYRYRSIDAVLNALSPILPACGLVILPTVVNKDVVERESKSGGTLLHVTLTMRYAFVSVADGSRHEIEVLGEAIDRADKAINKAMAAGFKYAVTQVFCIGYEGMSDADATTEQEPFLRPQRAPRAAVSRGAPGGQRLHVPTHEVDATIARWADEIDCARSVADLDAIGSALRDLPESIRLDLRWRYKDRMAALRGAEGNFVEHDVVDRGAT